MFINDLFNKNITESQTEKPSAFDTAKNAIGGAASKLGDVLPQAFKPFDEKTYTPQQTTKSTNKVARKGGIEEATADDPKFQQMMNKVAQQKTPQQHMEELENVLNELNFAAREIREATTEIKYDQTAQSIMNKVEQLIKPFRHFIDNIDYKDPFERVVEAKNELQSAIYGLDDLIKRAEYTISNQIQDIQDAIDYPDDEQMEEGRRGGVIRSGSISEGLYPGEYYTFLVKFDDGSTETLNFSSDDIDWDRVGDKRNKKVVGVKMQGGIQGEPHDTPSKPHDFPDDRGLARAQRAYDRKIPENKDTGSPKWISDEEDGYTGPSVHSIVRFLVKTDDGKKYRVLGTSKLNAIKKMKHLHPDLEVVGIKFLENVMSLDGQIVKGINDGSVEKLPDVNDPLAKKLADRIADNLKYGQENYGFSKYSPDEIGSYGKEGNIKEAANSAQQAAIAISMKKAGKKPKVTNEDIENYVESMQRHGYESVEEQKCPECGGVAYSDKMIAEEKDACYHKVKSRYKIWPSAYASGALVKCRKAGAKNWGNKSKK